MTIRYLAAVLVTSLSLAPAVAGPAAGSRCDADLRAHYSPRALRRIRAELQLRLLKERRLQMRRAYGILAHRGSPEMLLQLPDDAEILAQGEPDARMKHLSLEDATICW